jgi:hypothetical protein
MNPSILKRHVNIKHRTLKDKSAECFTSKREGIDVPSAAVTMHVLSRHQALQEQNKETTCDW